MKAFKREKAKRKGQMGFQLPGKSPLQGKEGSCLSEVRYGMILLPWWSRLATS
jgi:hypothetical protein